MAEFVSARNGFSFSGLNNVLMVFEQFNTYCAVVLDVSGFVGNAVATFTNLLVENEVVDLFL